jgi:hypothetical protein
VVVTISSNAPCAITSYDRKLWTGEMLRAAYPGDEESPLR